MDAVAFAKANLEELQARLTQSKVPTFAPNDNFGLTEDQVIEKFFADQGLNFAPYNVEDVKALLVETPVTPTIEPTVAVEEQ